MVFTFLENALNLGIFTHALFPPSPLKTYHNILIITPSAEGNFSFPRQYFFKNLFLPTVERGGGSYGLFYQNSIRKYEDDLEH